MSKQEQTLVSALAELDVPEGSSPGADALNRIKEDTLKRVKLNQKQTRPAPLSKGFRKYIAAAAIVATIAISLAGPAQVLAGLQKVMGLVPGFGLIERQPSGFVLLAADQPRAEFGEGFIQVSGLLAQPGHTYLNLYVYQVDQLINSSKDKAEQHEAAFHENQQKLKQIYLVDEFGREYRSPERALFSWASSNRDAHIAMELMPLDEMARLLTLVVPLPDGEQIRLDVRLVSLSEVDEWGTLANTTTVEGITVSGAAHFGSDTRVSLFVLPSDPFVVRIESVGGFFHTTPVTLTGDSGRLYELQRRGQSFQPNYYEMYFDPVDPGDTTTTFSIPVLLFQEAGKASTTIPVPAAGQVAEFNKTVTLGRFPLTFTRSEVIAYSDAKTLRIYVDLGPEGTKTFESFALDTPNGGWSSKYNELTGQIEYFEVPLSGSPRQLNLKFKDPVYSIKGPWTIVFPVN
jgi:hypothetical protein